MDRMLTLPAKVQSVIDAYACLNFGREKCIPCPYFINKRRKRLSIPVLVGKGTPEEIVEEARIKAKVKAVDLDTLSVAEIDEFLRKNDLGVDCSGFLVHALRSLVSEKTGKDLLKILNPKKGLLSRIIFRFHTVKKINVEILTSDENSYSVHKVSDILPGDMIATKGGKHILLVAAVHELSVRKLKYWQSREGGEVCSGEIIIDHPDLQLSKQKWVCESDRAGEITVRRLRILARQ